MPRKAPVVLPPPTGDRLCCFCGLKDDNELEYGKFHEYNGIITHYYCLLLSSNMQQRGRDDEGILGFLPEDINKELKRGRRLACCYCKKIGATLGCCNTKCKKIFHFPCGLKAGSLHQFFGEFRSYCTNHRPKQNIDERVLKEVSHRDDKICYICYDEVNPHDMLGTLWAPCCKKNAWFHRTCVQQLAMSAGYFFKCPLCNNKIEFQRAMLDHGIFIPSQDASWELVPNAFQELLYRHNRCDAEKCLCPKGREHTSTNAKWELTLCRTCGSQGIHMACGSLKWVKPIWECNECISILNKTVTAGHSAMTTVPRSSTNLRVLRSDKALLTDDESSTDSDISVGGGFSEMPMETTTGSSSISQTSSYILRRILNDERRSNREKQQVTKGHDDRNRKSATSKSRRNSVTKDNETTNIPQNNDELPPLTKKPRIADSIVERNNPVAEDSDDDIIILSGPSNKDKVVTPTNEAQNSAMKVHQSLDNMWNFMNVMIEEEIVKQSNEKKSETESKMLVQRNYNVDEQMSTLVANASTNNQFTNSALPETQKRVPLEIELSDSESSSSTATSQSSTTNAQSTTNVIPKVPELNIKIINVTSLAPEAFANVPELTNETFDDPTNRQSQTNVHHVSQNILTYSSQQTHEQLPILRFDGTSVANNPTNSVLYRLTVPGTNNTVPLIISTSDLGKSTSSTKPCLGEILNNGPLKPSPSINPSPIPSTKKGLAGPKSRKAAIQAANAAKILSMQSNDNAIAIAPKVNINEISIPVTSKLSYSVPLETVVNDKILMSRPNSNKSCAANGIFDSVSPFMKITDLPDKPINTVTNSPQTNSTISNTTNSSSAQKPSVPIVSVNNAVSNGIVSSSVSPIYAVMQTNPFSLSPTNSKLPHGLVPPRLSQISKFPVGQVGTAVPIGFSNVNSFVNNVNTSGPINSPVANINGNVTATGYVSTANMQLPKTSKSDNEMGLYIIPTGQNNQASPENCDGDAGSGPAIQPTSDIASNTKSHRNVTTSACELVAATDNQDRSSVNRKFEYKDDTQNNANNVAQKYDAVDCATASNRGNTTDRTGLINKTINLRDLRFTVCGSNIVKMTIYETFCVKINVDAGSECKYAPHETSNVSRENSSDSFAGKTNRSLLARGDDILKNVNSDSDDLPSSSVNFSMISAMGNDHDEVLNQSSNNPQINLMTTESQTSTNELSLTEIHSHRRDELKENLDPVPPSSNLINNTSSNDRKSRSRLRGGVTNHTMQLLNDRGDTQETIVDENAKSSPRKISNRDQILVNNPSKISYNGWKENTCTASRTLVGSTDDETHSPNMSPDRRNENVDRKSTTCRSSIDGNSIGEHSNHLESSVKRPKYIMDGHFRDSHDRDKFAANNDSRNDSLTSTMSHLVSNAERLQNRKSSQVHVCQSENLHVNNILKEKKSEKSETNKEASLCCKVSIDLARIRSVLAKKLHFSGYLRDRKTHERTSHFNNANTEKDIFYSKSFQGDFPRKSRSVDNLPLNDCSSIRRSHFVKIRRCKSAEYLHGLSVQSRYEDCVNGFCTISVDENKRRGYKRKTRSFEKHDCVR